jgi:nitric oxide dioxygenase
VLLNTLVESKSARPISWVHGARDANARAFKGHVDALAKTDENVRTVYFNSRPEEDERQGHDYDIEGRVDLDKVAREMLFLDHDKTQYFACGPTQFMLDMEEKLKSYGVPSDRVKMERFGTGGIPRV